MQRDPTAFSDAILVDIGAKQGEKEKSKELLCSNKKCEQHIWFLCILL